MPIYKKKVVIFAICLSVFFTSSFGIYFDRTRDVYAFDFVITPTVMYYLLGTYLIGSGIVLAHENDLMNLAAQAWDNFQTNTEEVKCKIIEFKPKKNPEPDGPKGFWTLGAMGLGWFGQLIDGFKKNETVENLDYTALPDSLQIEIDWISSMAMHYKFKDATTVYIQKVGSSEASRTNNALSLFTHQDRTFRYVSYSSSNNDLNFLREIRDGEVWRITLPKDAIVTKTPSSVVSDYVPNLESPGAPPLTIPGNPEGSVVLNPDDLIGTDWDSIKDKVTGGEVALDPAPNPNPNPNPDTNPNPDSNPNPGVGDLSTEIPNDIKLDFSPLYVSFAQKFPFCIPFDLVNSIRSFSVSRETPKFNVFFDETVFLGGGSFTIDFSKFTVIAAILRYFILLSFLVSLVKVTRDLIKG